MRHRISGGLLIVLGCLVATGCGLPRDVEQTTDAALGRGYLRAGAVAGAETLSFDDAWNPGGSEADLVEGFAEELGLGVRWEVASEHEVMDALQDGDLDIVVGGIKKVTPWSTKVALSAPLSGSGDEAIVAAVPKGENRWLLAFERYLARSSPHEDW